MIVLHNFEIQRIRVMHTVTFAGFEISTFGKFDF